MLCLNIIRVFFDRSIINFSQQHWSHEDENLRAYISQKAKTDIQPMPSREEIIEKMYDKGLDSYTDEVVNFFYSKYRSMRYVILKDKRGLLTYQLEAIYQFDIEEWAYICTHDAMPAMWQQFNDNSSISFFENMDELLSAINEEPEYKLYFA